jgi:hypothetical protein
MPSKTKTARESQKEYWENKLTQRIGVLTEKGLEQSQIAKDTAVKKIRAELRKTEARLKTIADLEQKAAQMAKMKAEKMATPKQEKGAKKKKKAQEEATMSKRQAKKKKKKESKQAGS